MRLNPRSTLLLSIATAVLGFWLTLNTLNGLKKNSVMVVTSVRDLAVGETLSVADVHMGPAPRGTDLGVSLRNVDKAIGKTTRNSIRRGQVVTSFDLVSPEDDIAGLIPPGYRASTISLSLSKETIQYLRFGTRVDIIFADTSNKNFKTKTIMRNILVIRVSTPPGSGGGLVKAFVTLAVRPEAAETLAYAMNRGKVDLSIRPIGDRNVTEEFLTLDQLLGTPKGITGPTYQSEIELIKGVKKDTVRL